MARDMYTSRREFGRFLNLLEDVVKAGIHVVLNAHAKMRKFEQPDELGAYDRWEIELEQKRGPYSKGMGGYGAVCQL